MLVPEAELAAPPRRLGARRSRSTGAATAVLFARHIEQADKGCDFDFLAPDFGKPTGEPDIY